LKVLSLLAVANASPSWTAMEPGSSIPEDWKDVGPAPRDEKIELVFAIKQRAEGVKKLLGIFNEVSDPKHPSYGEYLSNEEVHKLVAPIPEAVSNVTEYLQIHGFLPKYLTPNADFISVTVPVHAAEIMLAAEYRIFQHTQGHKVYRTMSYGLPQDISAFVDFVSCTSKLPPPNPTVRFDTSPRLKVTPKGLRELYSVGSNVGKSSKNRFAVTAFLGQHYHPADLTEFWNISTSLKALPIPAPEPKEVGDSVEGLFAGTEAMLDIEYINALGAGVPSEFWGFSGRSPDNTQNEPFIKWLTTLSNTSDDTVPLIFSTSYGEDEASTTQETADRTNIEFQKAAVRGISLLFASGDSGAAGVSPAGCPDGTFVPKWPAGSPYVTGVGGTTGTAPEAGAGLSSGGFCNRWPTPSWQVSATKEYLTTATGVPEASFFNSSGRGFPDVSAQATGFTVVTNRLPMPGVAGTSCASPTASGVFGLLNDLRLEAGKPPLGFLNPFIYQNMEAFNDVTSGSNEGCGLGKKGFPASKGWDPVTGVGTPNYSKLSAVVAALP